MSGFVLEGEGLSPIENPTNAKVRDVIECLGQYDTSFAALVAPNGDYVQAAGDGEFCTVEKRQHNPLNHTRAYYLVARDIRSAKTTLKTGAGEMSLEPDEFIRLKMAADIFEAILEGCELEPSIAWRSQNEILGL